MVNARATYFKYMEQMYQFKKKDPLSAAMSSFASSFLHNQSTMTVDEWEECWDVDLFYEFVFCTPATPAGVTYYLQVLYIEWDLHCATYLEDALPWDLYIHTLKEEWYETLVHHPTWVLFKMDFSNQKNSEQKATQ